MKHNVKTCSYNVSPRQNCTRIKLNSYSLNSKEWESQSSLEGLFGSIKKIDTSIYQEWKSLNFLHMSIISNFKEWIFTLQRVKFQSFHTVFPQYNLFQLKFKFNKHKRESLERDCTEGTLCERIENFTLKNWYFHSLQFEISLVWGKISDFHSF